MREFHFNMKLTFELTSGVKIFIIIIDKEECITIGQYTENTDGVKSKKRCTVTSHNGKSYSWTCTPDKEYSGDCSHPDNPKGIYA